MLETLFQFILLFSNAAFDGFTVPPSQGSLGLPAGGNCIFF